jgi:hypothetical protein
VTLVGDFVTGQPLPFQRMRQLLADSGGVQEGVVGAGDFLVTQRAAGANMSVDVAPGLGWIRIDTGSRNGLAHVASDAVENRAVAASHVSLPRLDQVVARYNDTSIPTGSGNVPTLEVLAGTPTSGATLDNRSGHAALPNDCMLVRDILVPSGSTSVINANMRDRRPWARGAFAVLTRTAGTVSTASTSPTVIDATTLQARFELSGSPARITLNAVGWNATAFDGVTTGYFIDGADDGTTAPGQTMSSSASAFTNAGFTATIVPVPGSHTLAATFAALTGGTARLNSATTTPLRMIVEEILRPNTTNN